MKGWNNTSMQVLTKGWLPSWFLHDDHLQLGRKVIFLFLTTSSKMEWEYDYQHKNEYDEINTFWKIMWPKTNNFPTHNIMHFYFILVKPTNQPNTAYQLQACISIPTSHHIDHGIFVCHIFLSDSKAWNETRDRQCGHQATLN